MAFAYNARRGGGGGGRWAHSLLPSFTLTSKSKLPRRPRRRATALLLVLRDSIFANFFTIGLSISVLVFLVLVLRYGVPKTVLSSRFKPRPSRLRKPFLRRPGSHDDASSSAAAVDITTKDLYDQIDFFDAADDDGPWKQGWKLTFKGDEWDSEKLKVFVVPHSHNDPGWKFTAEEYYELQSRHILDTIVETLTKHWNFRILGASLYGKKCLIWKDAPVSRKEAFIGLVNNGQLEIVGGGWVMNDEANTHYFVIIEQITEGNMWLNDNIGVVPKNSWAIDTFGYSPTMAYLLRRMGFENMLIQRTHYELKKELALHKNLEFIWRQSWDADETTDIFVHMMPFYSYDIPHTCGPDPNICCQFDFARKHGFLYEPCPWGEYPVETNQDNVHERAPKLLDQYKKKSTLYRTNTLLIPLGDDFRYVSIDEAEAQFRNYQLLFDHINSNSSMNAEVKFGTLEDYFQTLREESDRINYSLPGEIGSAQVLGFPALSGDFFTYADRQQDYWSGYYVSRPFFKAIDRVLGETLRATEMMITLLLAYCQRPGCEKLPNSFSYKLTAARRNLALFQHHNGVTGTAKDHVVIDYGSRMHASLHDLQIFMSKAIEVLLGTRHEKLDQTPSHFEAAQLRSKFDMQPVHRKISLCGGMAQFLVFYNPLEQTRDEIVMVIVDKPDVTVLDSNWTCIKSQISPEFQHDKNKFFTGRHRVYWKASVPPMGLETYYVAGAFVGCEKAKPAKLNIYSNSSSFPCPPPYTCSKFEGNVAEIRNQHHALTFDARLGLLQKITYQDGTQTVVGEEISMYSGSESGAYLFKPDGDAEPIIQAGGQLVVVEGPLMQEVNSYPQTPWDKTPISHTTRLYNGDNTIQKFIVEKEYHVELLGDVFNDKQLITRYKTNINNKRVFYSDLNGFQMSRRETYDKIPLQGNYYPMPSLAFMQGPEGYRFSVHSQQSLGVASLKNGWLEIMLDRRLGSDDGHGLGQGVMDNHPMSVLFHILLESNLSSTPNLLSKSVPLSPSLLSHCVGAHLNYPLHAFIAKRPQEISVQPPPRSFSPLAVSLPCDLHIVSFKVPRPLKYSQQLIQNPRSVILLHRLKWDSSYWGKSQFQCSSVDDEPVNLFYLFKGLTVLNAKATSINLLREDTEILRYAEQFGDLAQEGLVLISPMEIQAYKLELRPHHGSS